MPRSSGTYSLPAGNPVISGTVISSTVQNNTLNDIANELTNSIPRDGSAPPTGNIPMGNFKLTGIGAATLINDVPQYQQIQSGASSYLTAVAGTNTMTATLATPTLPAYVIGQSFRFIATTTNTGASTLNINGLGALPIIKNGVALIAGDIFTGQAYQVIYDGTSMQLFSQWQGAPFTDANALIKNAADPTKLVKFNAANLTTATTRNWTVQDKDITVAGLSDINVLAPLTAVLTANTLVATLTASTASPWPISFRNATLNVGGSTPYSFIANSTITAPTAASLGLTTLVQGRIAILEAYNGGAPVMCYANLAGGLQLDETNLISPTTISAGATSANVIYSASAVSANSPYRMIGFVDVIWTSGTGFTTLSTVQPIGGQALAALSSLGYGQTWQAVTRTIGTTYYNTTGKPITSKPLMINASVYSVICTINGFQVTGVGVGGGTTSSDTFIIPPGASYVFSGGTSMSSCAELR